MRSIIIENVDLMSEEEEIELKNALAGLNVEWTEIGHDGKRTIMDSAKHKVIERLT